MTSRQPEEAPCRLPRRAGYRPELAWTCCDDADTLLHRDGPGDQERAMSLLDEALSITRALDMPVPLGRMS